MLKNTVMTLMATLPALAYSEDAANNEQYCCPLLPPEPVDSCQLPSGIFYPAQYTLGECSWNVRISGEWIYWVFARDGGESSLATKITNLAGPVTDAEEIFHRPGYQSGFRIAAGAGLPGCDNAEIDLEYTWFHTTTTNHFNASAAANEFLNPRYITAGFMQASSLRSVFKAHLDFLALTVGRPFYASKRFTAKAGLGIKTWWTSQDENLFFVSPNGPLTQLSKSGGWGIGPYFAVHVNGILGCGFYLAGKAGLWPTYTRFTKHRIETNFPPVFLNNVETNHGRPYIAQLFYESGVGLGWGAYFCNCAYHVDVSAIYELINSFILDTLFSFGLPQREAYIQGLALKAEFAF